MAVIRQLTPAMDSAVPAEGVPGARGVARPGGELGATPPASRQCHGLAPSAAASRPAGSSAGAVPVQGLVPPVPAKGPTAVLVPPLPWLHLLAPPPTAAGSSTVTVCASDGAVCHLSAEFASACTTISIMLEDANASDVLPLTSVGADELSHLVCAFSTATEHESEVWGHLSTQQVATCLRASSFLGLDELRSSAVSHLAERLRGLDVDAMRAACEADASDFLSPAQQGLVVTVLSDPSVGGLAAVTASLAEPHGADGHGSAALGLDWDSALLLLGTMDLHDLAPFLSSSRSACGLLFSPGFDEGMAFKAWAAVLGGRHPALSSLFSSIATVPAGDAASSPAGEVATGWSEPMEQMFSIWNVLRWLDDHSSSGNGATEDPTSQYTWLLNWVRDQCMAVGSAPTAACSRRMLRSVPLSLLFNCVYLLSTLKPPHNHAEALYALAAEAVEMATTTSAQRLSSIVSSTTAVVEAEGATQQSVADAAEPGALAMLRASLNAEWTQLRSVHDQLVVVFQYLDQHYTAKAAVPELETVCRESRDRCEAWQDAQSTWSWLAPEEPTPPEVPQADEPLVLIFADKSTLRVTVRQLQGCQSLLAQLAADRAYAAQPVGGEAEPFLFATGCSRVAMIKLIEYTQGIAAADTEEDKAAFTQAYKSSMEAQEQLGLLFRTMTAANMVGQKALLDELTKAVAAMIASRTPDEIQEFFNIKKDATWEEEVELMRQNAVRASFVPCANWLQSPKSAAATSQWIDPEGLIAKDRAARGLCMYPLQCECDALPCVANRRDGTAAENYWETR